MRLNERHCVPEMISLKTSLWISCDHTFKVACNIEYLQEEVQRYNSVPFITWDESYQGNFNNSSYML